MASNGRLDVNTLTKVPLTAGGVGYLENFTARGWFAAREDLIRTTGTIPVIISDGLYRDYARQVYWKQYWTRLGKPNNAATPGTSNHGLGTAVDVNNISAYSQKSLDAIMARHGFVRDTSESWHYHHTSINPADSGSTPIPEESTTILGSDMPLYYSYVSGDPSANGRVVSLDTANGTYRFPSTWELAGIQNEVNAKRASINPLGEPQWTETFGPLINIATAPIKPTNPTPVINVQELADAIVAKMSPVVGGNGLTKNDIIEAVSQVISSTKLSL